MEVGKRKRVTVKMLRTPGSEENWEKRVLNIGIYRVLSHRGEKSWRKKW